MHTFLISIGSNENKDENISLVQDILKEKYLGVVFSDLIETEPIGDVYQSNFYNQLAVFESRESVDAIIIQLKEIETSMGRLKEDKSKGIVKIDLDLMSVGTTIMSDDLFERPYLKTLLKTFKTELSFYLDCMGYFEEN